MSSQLSTVASQGLRTGPRRRSTLFWVGAEGNYRAFLPPVCSLLALIYERHSARLGVTV